ncbi:hypothetical protein NECID01_0848 [Nematocida sp. AWRm77]|nr:hypothetical protein NECID01_0848 [Nematocida sp. AWRm77]
MNFTAENANTDQEKEDRLVEEYHVHLGAGCVEGLLDLARSIEEEKGVLLQNIWTLSLTNALRLATAQKDYETSAEIVEYAGQNNLAEGKIEYFEETQQYVQAVSLSNHLLKKENLLYFQKKKAVLREKYGFPSTILPCSKRLELDSCLYTLLWELYLLIEKETASTVSEIVVVEKAQPAPLWKESTVKWASASGCSAYAEARPFSAPTLFSSSVFLMHARDITLKEKEADSALGSAVPSANHASPAETRYAIGTLDCIVAVADLFSSLWRTTLCYTEEPCSFYMAYITVVEYIPKDRMTENILSFCHINLSLGSVAPASAPGTPCPAARINSLVEQICKKIITCTWSPGSNRNTARILRKKQEPQALKDPLLRKEQNAINQALIGYLVGDTSTAEVFDTLVEHLQAEVQLSFFYGRVLEKACLEEDPDMVLFCMSAAPQIDLSLCKDVFLSCALLSQSYFLSRVLKAEYIPPEKKQELFLDIPFPAKELFVYNDAINLLLLSSPGTHLPFFAHFIRMRTFLSTGTLHDFSGKKVCLAVSSFSRAVELIRKYLKAPEKMYLAPLTDINPVYSKVFEIFLYRKEYEAVLAIAPFNALYIAEYIKHLHAQAISIKYKKKHAIGSVYDMCRKIANLFVLCMLNLPRMSNLEALEHAYNEGLGTFLALKVLVTEKTHKLLRSIPSAKKELWLLGQALQTIRNRYPELPRGHEPEAKSVSAYGFLRYDLWRVMSLGLPSSPVVVSVLQCALVHISTLAHVEFDYLVKIRVQKITESFWAPLLSTAGTSSRACVLLHAAPKEVFSEYIQYLVNSTEEDMSLFLFSMLKVHKDISAEEVEDIIGKMFFDANDRVICTFSSWIPNLGLIKRKEYFRYFFEYLEKNNPKLLKEVKAEIRKEGLPIE